MSEEAALRAFEKASQDGDAKAAEKAAQWLHRDNEICARFDLADVASEILRTGGDRLRDASGDTGEAMRAVALALHSAPGTLLVGLFGRPGVQADWSIGNVRLAPAREILAEGVVPEVGAPHLSAARLAVCVAEPSSGSRGARRSLQLLRATLGSLYLAGYALGTNSRVGPVPADGLAPTLYVGSPGGLVSLVQTMRITDSVPIDIDGTLENEPMRQLIEDCVAPDPSSYLGERLQSAAAWLQVGFDALTYPDAVIALGIALEALVGGQKGSDTVKTVSIRTGFLLREGGNSNERTLNALDWRNRAKKVYAERSAVAHGRYAEGDPIREASNRSEFEELVCRVALRFREIGSSSGWKGDKDIDKWQELLEMS